MTKLQFTIVYMAVASSASAAENRTTELFVSIDRGGIQRFDTLGNSLGGFSVEDSARTIAVDRLGNVYTTSSFNNPKDVRKYSRMGDALGTFATVGTDDSHVLGLVFDANGTLYIGTNYCCGSGRDTVEHVASNGTPLGTFATSSTGPPGATFELVFDRSGRLYVPDHDFVERFDTAGNSLGRFVTLNTSSFIVDLAFDSLGNLYVMTFDDMIRAFDASGGPLGTILAEDDFFSMAIDKNDVLYVGGSDSIRRFRTDGSPLDTFKDALPGFVLDMEFADIVPEPQSIVLVAFGAIGLGVWPLRRRSQRNRFANGW